MSEQHKNELGQPIGAPLPNWSLRPLPPRTPIEGRYSRVEPLEPARHAADLFAANSNDAEGRNWAYLPYGPFASFDLYREFLEAAARRDDPLVHVIVDRASGWAVGVASLMRIDPAAGVIEVGGINYSPRLQRRPATEAMYLLMRRVFDELGYRRYEWKCDSFNAPSRSAAQRIGFRYEGLFRQATVYKDATATPPGFRSSTASGRRCGPHSSAGSIRPISTARAASALRFRACTHRSRAVEGAANHGLDGSSGPAATARPSSSYPQTGQTASATFWPFGLPSPVQASQPVAAAKLPLLPWVTSRSAAALA